MKALFANDQLFTLDARGDVYTCGELSFRTWQHYLGAFDELLVVGRGDSSRAAPDLQTARGELTYAGGPGVEFCLVPNLSGPAAALMNRARVVRRLSRAIESVDAVIARLPSENGLLAAKICARLAKPWMVEVVGCALECLQHHGSPLARLYAPLMHARTRRAVSRARLALYVTNGYLQNVYPCRGYVAAFSDVCLPAPEPATLDAGLARAARGPTRARPLVLGFIGSLQVRYKGLHVALKALANLRNILPPFEVRVLGSGDLRPWQQLAGSLGLTDHVTFFGVLPGGATVFEWLDEIDVYLQPSLAEGLPRSLVEAMSRATPALASRAGGIPELLRGEVLHRPGDHHTLGKHLLTAMTSPSWRATQARRNFNFAKQFAAPTLDPLRQAFWRAFASSITSPHELARGRPSLDG